MNHVQGRQASKNSAHLSHASRRRHAACLTVMVPNIPAAEWTVDEPLVRALLREQAPALAGSEVRAFGHGWDNEMFAVGDTLLARLPRRAQSVPSIRHEAAWLPVLAARLTVPIPNPVLVGKPGTLFPHPWLLVPLLPGTTAATHPVSARGVLAPALARFLIGLHRPAPADAPRNPFRGQSLDGSALRSRISARLDALGAASDDLRPRWEAWSNAPPWPHPPVWLHGDLHPLNILMDAVGHLSGVLDWGDVTSGDPACDLAAAWLLFDRAGRADFWAVIAAEGDYDAAITQRAAAWALHFGLIFASMADNQPLLTAVGDHTLAALRTAAADRG